jgi:hypothetical protein
MLVPLMLPLLLSTGLAAPTPNPQFTEGTVVTISGAPNTTVLGNYYNNWVKPSPDIFDLTRSGSSPITTSLTIPMLGSRKTAIIEPTRSALVIIDMQNFFLHPELSPKATGGRKAVQPTLNMIDGFRSKGMKVLWTNWGLDGYDLLTIPPSFLSGFSEDDDPLSKFQI